MWHQVALMCNRICTNLSPTYSQWYPIYSCSNKNKRVESIEAVPIHETKFRSLCSLPSHPLHFHWKTQLYRKKEMLPGEAGVLFSFLNLFILIYFIFFLGCIGFSSLCAGFLQLQRAGATLCCSARASHCGGFSCCGARALGVWASVVVAHGLSSCGLRAVECRLSSCGSRAQLLHGMWDLPGPGIEPVSPALAGGFLTTVPPGKPRSPFFVF